MFCLFIFSAISFIVLFKTSVLLDWPKEWVGMNVKNLLLDIQYTVINKKSKLRLDRQLILLFFGYTIEVKLLWIILFCSRVKREL